MSKTYEQVAQEFETALNNLVNYEGDKPPMMVSEYVVFTASTYMEDESLNAVTNYNWFCMPGITHGHLMGLIEMGKKAVYRELEDLS